MKPTQSIRVTEGDEILVEVKFGSTVGFFPVKYAELKKLATKGGGKHTYVQSVGGSISRVINLYYRAIKTGKWSTGVPITQDVCVAGIIAVTKDVEFHELSPSAQARIRELTEAGILN